MSEEKETVKSRERESRANCLPRDVPLHVFRIILQSLPNKVLAKRLRVENLSESRKEPFLVLDSCRTNF